MAQDNAKGWRSLPLWLRVSVMALLVLGIAFRFVNLDRKVYWTDETLSSLRMSGYTRSELTQGIFTGQVIRVDQVQQYQRPTAERGWNHTFRALMSTAEHTPLYFLLSRLWVEGSGGYSVAAMRSLPAVISLLGFPCLVWLSWELFQSAGITAIAVGLFAVTPLHVLYAQEARPYSLWTVCTLLSSATLLWAIRSQTRRPWICYSLTLLLGIYTQLLFAAVAIAQGLYVLTIERVLQKRQLSQTARSYLLAAVAALVGFLPWLLLLLNNLNRVRSTTQSLTEAHPFPYLVSRWFLNINRALIGDDIESFNFVIVLLCLYALFEVCRRAPLRVWLLLVLLVGVPFLALAGPDLILGGERSTRVRYLIPAYMGLQLALAYLFGTQAVWARAWSQKIWRILLTVLVVCTLFACIVSAQADIWWNKGISRGAYYLTVPGLINATSQPLVISDSRASEILALSYRLADHVRLQLVSDPKDLEIAEGFNPVLLINPSRKLRRVLSDRDYQLTLIYKDPYASDGEEERLWQVTTRRTQRSPDNPATSLRPQLKKIADG